MLTHRTGEAPEWYIAYGCALVESPKETNPMRRVLIMGTLLATLVGCSRPADRPNARDDRSERQRDSVLGASQLPGAAGVRHALEASDSGAARRNREDSVTPGP